MPPQGIVPPPPAPGSILPGVGPSTIKGVALQSRPLSSAEAAIISQNLGDAVDPNDVRIAYDKSISGTDVKAYVISRGLPTVVFSSPSAASEIPSSLMHEITHVWQNLHHDRYTNTIPIVDTYNPQPGKPFASYGPESQAVLTEAGDKSAQSFISAHRVRAANPADVAFLDSVRAAYGDKSGLGQDTDARLATTRKDSFRGVRNGELMADASPDKAQKKDWFEENSPEAVQAKGGDWFTQNAPPSASTAPPPPGHIIRAAPKPFTVPWIKSKLWTAEDKATNLLPAAGATLGGIVGTFGGGPPGAIAGATIGGGGGEAARQLIRRAEGMEAPKSPSEAAEAIGKEGLLQGAVQGATELMPPAGAMLKKAALGQYERALAPTTKANKVITSKIAPGMIDRRIAGPLESIEKKAGANAATSKPTLDAAYTAMPASSTAGSGSQILKDLDTLKSKYIVAGKVARPEAVNAIDGIQDIVRQYGNDISPDSLRKLKAIFDDPVAAKGGYAGADLTVKYGLRAQKAAANSIRNILHSASPDVAALDKEVSFWLDVQKVARESGLRKTGQEGGLAKTFGPVAAGVGAAAGLTHGVTGSLEGAALGALGSAVAYAIRTPAWRTASALVKDRLAEFLANGDVKNATALLARFGVAAPAIVPTGDKTDQTAGSQPPAPPSQL